MRTIFLFFLFTTSVIFAQDFQGIATYKTHRKVDLKIDEGKNAPNEEMQKQIQEQLRKQFQRTFILNFTKEESIYKQEAQLASPQPPSNGVNIVIAGNGGGSDIYYKNIKENRFVNKTEIMGKRFLIKDSLPKTDWVLSGETKNIGRYTCYKATSERIVQYTSISVQDGKTKEDKKSKKVVTTAWYTPQVAVSNGPRNYGGLPGLILEINDDNLTIVCSEIILNPKNKLELIEPTKGKIISQKDFSEITQKKQKERMEQLRSGRRNGDQVQIRIGG